MLPKPPMESQRHQDIEVKRYKVQGGNGRGQSAGMDWGQSQGRAEETEGVLRKLGRYLKDDEGTAGPGSPQEAWDPSCAWSTRSSISYCLHSNSVSVFKLGLCSFNASLQAVQLFSVSVVFLKLMSLGFHLYSCFHTFVVIAVMEKLDFFSSSENMLQTSNPVLPLQRQSCGREQA